MARRSAAPALAFRASALFERLEDRRLLAASVSTTAGHATADASTSPRRVIGYLPSYRQSSLGRIDFSALTHVNYFAVRTTGTGTLTTTNVVPANLAAAKNAAHAAGVTISITVGPQENEFLAVAASTATLNTFVTNIISYVQANDLDGIDIDWEPPASDATERARYAALVDALYAQAKPLGLLLSAAVNPITTEIPPAAASKLDWINIMGYDFDPANHSPYASSVASLPRWNTWGVAKDKLVLGVPFYGRSGTTWTNTVARTYGALVDDYVAANGTYPAPSIDNIGGYYFNGVSTIKAKSQYVIDNNYGGVMIWELGQDHFTASGAYDQYSLLPAIKSVIQPTQPTLINTVTATPASGSSAYANEAKTIAANVSAHIATAGVLQALLVRSDGTVAAEQFHAIAAGADGYQRTFNLAVTETSAGLRGYSIVVRFRPGATTGPLGAAANGDVVSTSTYNINWQAPRDQVAPTVTASAFAFETARAARFSFSEDVSASVAASDVTVRRVSDNAIVPMASFTYDAPTKTANFVLVPGLADGNYRATLAAGSVADAAGNGLASASTLEFFVLAGDANRDRTVGFADLVILSQNFNLAGKTFSQGNFDYSVDGAVNFHDLVLLVQRYGSLVAQAVAIVAPVTAATTTKRQRAVDAVRI